MRTLLLLSTAAASLFGVAQSASAFTQNPAPALDYGAPGAPDDRVYAGNADRAPAASETPPPAQPDAVYGGSYDAEGRWAGAWDGSGQPSAAPYNGNYDASGRWTGTWDGTFQASDGRFYRGYYQGTVEGRPGTSYAPPPPAPASAPAPPGTYYSTAYPGGGRGQGYSYGYGGYSPGSVTITTSPPVVTETVETTTETFYE